MSVHEHWSILPLTIHNEQLSYLYSKLLELLHWASLAAKTTNWTMAHLYILYVQRFSSSPATRLTSGAIIQHLLTHILYNNIMYMYCWTGVECGQWVIRITVTQLNLCKLACSSINSTHRVAYIERTMNRFLFRILLISTSDLFPLPLFPNDRVSVSIQR